MRVITSDEFKKLRKRCEEFLEEPVPPSEYIEETLIRVMDKIEESNKNEEA